MKIIRHVAIHVILLMSIWGALMWVDGTKKYTQDGYYRGVVYEIKTVCDKVCEKYIFIKWNTGGETMNTLEELKYTSVHVGDIILTQYQRLFLGISPSRFMPHDPEAPLPWKSALIFMASFLVFGGYVFYVIFGVIHLIAKNKRG